MQNMVSSVFKNFFIMEPLSQTSASGLSTPRQEEVVVASVRSAINELRESMRDLCKASMAKIATIGLILFSSLVLSCLLFSTVKVLLFVLVNQGPGAPTLLDNSTAAAANATAANSGLSTTQNTGTLIPKDENKPVLALSHELLETCSSQFIHSFSAVYEMKTGPPPMPPPRNLSKLLQNIHVLHVCET